MVKTFTVVHKMSRYLLISHKTYFVQDKNSIVAPSIIWLQWIQSSSAKIEHLNFLSTSRIIFYQRSIAVKKYFRITLSTPTHTNFLPLISLLHINFEQKVTGKLFCAPINLVINLLKLGFWIRNILLQFVSIVFGL